ncbi:MAG TPA: hypothetical protein VLZ12_09810 [Verrucomicrobiae bacterium]|nr:hypothetical protein [Verrucomicrobiae bacterium]
MKRAGKFPHAQQDLLAALGTVRQLVREVGGNYLASLQSDVAAVERAVRQSGGDELPDRKRLGQFRAMLSVINDLDLKPQKGRRRDLRKLDRVISKLSDVAGDW